METSYTNHLKGQYRLKYTAYAGRMTAIMTRPAANGAGTTPATGGASRKKKGAAAVTATDPAKTAMNLRPALSLKYSRMSPLSSHAAGRGHLSRRARNSAYRLYKVTSGRRVFQSSRVDSILRGE